MHMNLDILIGLSIGALFGGFAYARLRSGGSKREYQTILEKADVESREVQLTLREERANLELAYKLKEAELQREIVKRTDQLDATERVQARTAELSEERLAVLIQREKAIKEAQTEAEEAEHEAKKKSRLYKMKLHQIAQMDTEQARQHLIQTTERECAQELEDLRKHYLGKTESELSEEARRVLLASMQRITSQPMNDATATVVSLPSEEMKGRSIGRERI